MITQLEKLSDTRRSEILAPFFSLKSSQIPEGKIVIESEKVLLKALRTQQKFHYILCTDEAFQKNREHYDSVQVFIAPKKVLAETIGYNLHHGHFALIEKPHTYSIKDLNSPIMILNGLTNGENVGAIMRNCSGFGVESLIIDEKCASPFLRRASRVSMGCVFNLKIHETQNLLDTIKELRRTGVKVLATAIRDHSQNFYDYQYPENFAIVIGSEGHGMDQEVINSCDEVLFIPMAKDTEALNAACSSAVFLSKI